MKPSQRTGCFKEVELGLTVSDGVREAHRCLYCGPCSECLEKEELCEADEAVVDEDRCIACANCENVCEYGAIKVEKSVAKVNPTLCKGCGTCVVECPAEAISMQNLSDEKLQGQLKETAASWVKEERPHAVAFICNWSYNPDAEGFTLPKNAHVIPVKCTGRVDPLLVLRAFLLGADGVLIISCREENCHYVFGSPVAEQRAKQMKEWLEAVGIDPQRLLLETSSVGMEQHLDDVFKSFAAMLEDVGSTPLKEALAQTKAAES